jgi:hypothetical protein
MQDVSFSIEDVPAPTSTLREQCMARLLNEALCSTDLTWLSEAELLPDFQTALRAKLYQKPNEVHMDLLARAFKGEAIIDLSPFRFSFAEIKAILQKVWKENLPATSRSLSLPGISKLTVVELTAIIEEFAPSKLVLGDTPLISLQQQLEVMKSTSPRVTDFISRALHERALRMDNGSTRQLAPEAFNIGTQSLPQISQIVYLKPLPEFPSQDVPRLSSGSIEWSALLPTINVFDGIMETAAVILPLRDALIFPERVPSLWKMIRHLRDVRERTILSSDVLGPAINKIAREYASADGNRPLPGELLAEYNRYSAYMEPPPRFLRLGPEQWTLLVVCDLLKEDLPASYWEDTCKRERRWLRKKMARENQRLRYSFIRSSVSQTGEKTVDALDWPAMMRLSISSERFEEIGGAWDEATKDLRLTSCGDDEVREALVYLEERENRITDYCKRYECMIPGMTRQDLS